MITVHIDGGGTDVGPYTLSCSYELTSGNSGNFNIYDAGKNFEIVKNDSPVTLTADSASKPYDGTALTASGFTVSGLPGTLTVNATVTGSQTYVGEGVSAIADYTIMNGGNNVTGNFTEIITVNGTLTVTENGTSITLTPKSCSKVYDGTPLNGSEVIAEGLPGGFSVSATFDGSQTAYGSSNVTIAGYTVLNASSEDVTGYFTGVTTASGTLSVDKLQIELDLGGTTRQYNGSYGDGLTPKLKYLNGDYTNTVISPSSLNQYPGGCNASFSLYTGDTATLTVSGYTSYDADTYTLSGSCNLSRNPSYSVSTTNNKVVITPAPITVSSVSISETKTYDGIPLPENTNQPDIIGTVYDQIEVYKLSDQITDAGEKTLKFTIEWPDDKTSGNYTVTEEYGTLKITKAALKITSKDGEKVYDGEPLVKHECDIEGMVEGESVTISYTGSQTEIGYSPNYFDVIWDHASKGNYELTQVFGTLNVLDPDDVVPISEGGT